MATRKASPPPEGPILLTLSRQEAVARIDDRIAKGEGLLNRAITNDADLEKLKDDYYTWTEYNQEMLRQMFTTPKFANEYAARFSLGRDEGSLAEEVSYVHTDIKDDTRRLESVKQRVELIPQAPGVAAVNKPNQKDSTDVFIVHGHDDGLREMVARFVSKLALNPVVLHEQASQGRTIVEKLETHGDVGFAIVLLTPDDVGGNDEEDLKPRARQNVVLELGYFLGRLQRNRVCAIYKGDDLELPSDYMGVIYIPFDSAGGWRLQLARELKAADLPVDMNKAL